MPVPARRPNIVMILTDDHAAHSIGAYGSVVNETPRIDEIARCGWRLDNCFATNALCSPSRASILTGTYSHINGVTTLATLIDASQPTFISQLRSAGYKTAMIGKWHLGDGDGHNPQGFDYWDVLIDQGEYWNSPFMTGTELRETRGYVTDIITDLALDWAGSLGGDDPWCMLIFHKAPHEPWEPDDQHKGRYAQPLPLPGTFYDDYSTRSSSARRAALRLAEHLSRVELKVDPPEGLTYDEAAAWKYQRFMEDYLACVASVDDNVGRVIDWLRERGAFDDTLLIYSSDQGFFLGDHGWFDKRLMYEESLRMPLVLSYPRRLEAGRVLTGMVTNVDIAQTILDAAGVAHHPRMQGRSFWPDLAGTPGQPPAEGVYYRYWEHDDKYHRAPAHYGYRTERYKIIYFYNDGLGLPGTGGWTYPPEWELYDLQDDPCELRNVYDDPAYAEVREDLKASMWLEQARLGDTPHPSQPAPARLSRDASAGDFSRVSCACEAVMPCYVRRKPVKSGRVSAVWEQHCCLPLEADCDLSPLLRYRDAGAAYVSVNAGYAPHGIAGTVRLLAAWRRQVQASESLLLATTVGDIRAARDSGRLAVGFDLEDTSPLGGQAAMVGAYYDLGVRSMVLTYNGENLAGFGCHAPDDTGLTGFGRAVVAEMNRVGMIVDLSHCGYRTSMDAMEQSAAPVIFSHSCLRALHDHDRNIRDDQLRRCAATGGVIGISGVGIFLGRGGASVRAMADHIDYAARLAGPGHVGIGTDYVFDTADLDRELAAHPQLFPDSYRGGQLDFVPPEGLADLAEELSRRGYPATDIAGIMGGNFCRVASQVWRRDSGVG